MPSPLLIEFRSSITSIDNCSIASSGAEDRCKTWDLIRKQADLTRKFFRGESVTDDKLSKERNAPFAKIFSGKNWSWNL
jgi:hypothetical protein